MVPVDIHIQLMIIPIVTTLFIGELVSGKGTNSISMHTPSIILSCQHNNIIVPIEASYIYSRSGKDNILLNLDM